MRTAFDIGEMAYFHTRFLGSRHTAHIVRAKVIGKISADYYLVEYVLPPGNKDSGKTLQKRLKHNFLFRASEIKIK